MTEVEQERKAKENNGDLGRGYSKRNNLIYLDDTLVNGADANSFETVSWDWAKDKMHYYYLGKPILEIDYPTFKLLDYHYSIDKNHVYYDDKIIEGADAKTFKYIDGSQDAKDKNSCYRYGEKVDCNVLLEE
ncbi:MAG: DKNYY domain-containing protein [Bacteroidetes bacterium]|nr:DKNYY domain-containing protein [Bacteroidota bacterium]